ncbi:hypothetical protein Q9Q99_12430 [Curtobacterium flaccumfaciens]|nr:hypothetical protein Q9Q99_12430 [Curtobacterium flaccumfaciens]
MYLPSDAPTWSEIRQLNAHGIVVQSRPVVLDPPDARLPGGQMSSTIGWYLGAMALLGVFAMFEVALLAGAAFLVGTRADTRSYAIVTSVGGDRRFCPHDRRRVRPGARARRRGPRRGRGHRDRRARLPTHRQRQRGVVPRVARAAAPAAVHRRRGSARRTRLRARRRTVGHPDQPARSPAGSRSVRCPSVVRPADVGASGGRCSWSSGP